MVWFVDIEFEDSISSSSCFSSWLSIDFSIEEDAASDQVLLRFGFDCFGSKSIEEESSSFEFEDDFCFDLEGEEDSVEGISEDASTGSYCWTCWGLWLVEAFASWEWSRWVERVEVGLAKETFETFEFVRKRGVVWWLNCYVLI